jgi:hypothetical protein
MGRGGVEVERAGKMNSFISVGGVGLAKFHSEPSLGDGRYGDGMPSAKS